MTAIDPYEIIQAILKTDFLPHHPKDKPPAKPAIAISRDHGAGGDEIAKRLSERLEIPLYDKNILDEVSQRMHVSKEFVSHLDEKLKGGWDAALISLITGESVFAGNYLRQLINVILALAPMGGIFVGRGANVILTNRPVFRLRIIGSETVCARRVAAEEGIDEEAAREKIRHINHERAEYLKKTMKRDINDAVYMDLIINTDRMHDWECVCDLVMQAMHNCHLLTETPAGVSR